MNNTNPKKILLVDDNQMFLRIMEKAFGNYGLECTISLSAEQAINQLKNGFKPDIILSDYEMLGMNGIEFRKYLVNEQAFKDIPFVFLTYFSNEDLIKTGLDLRAIDYVLKETPVKVIVSKINNILFAIDKQRELTEFEIKKAATSLNFKSIPVAAPNIAGFEIEFWHSAFADIPGGDFIDFIEINKKFNFIVLGDVMGKKWTAWFFTFGFLSYVRSAIRFAAFDESYCTSEILTKVNSILYQDNMLKDILSSLSLILLDTENGQLHYAGAGDLPLLHYSYANKEMVPIKSTGLLLGMFENAGFDDEEIVLKPEDKLFIFSDGMIDFSDENGKHSDYSRFTNTLLNNLNTGKNFDYLKSEVFNNKNIEPVDDRSIICITKK